MNRRPDNFTKINRYLNEELTELESRELEMELESNLGLAAELKFHKEVEEAVQEKDIESLRENLKRIIHHQDPANKAHTEDELVMADSYSFGLAEELSSIQNFKSRLNIDEIINFNHSFPKIHLYQHLVAAKENIYQFYKEQQEHRYKKDPEYLTPYEEALFEDIEDALTENDVLDLRANLKQIATSVSLHSHSASDIHDYVDGILDGEQRNKFEEDLKIDLSLANEVQLFKEVDMALAEQDIMDLRASLRDIRESSHMFTAGIEEMDGYINNTLSEDQMAMFENELVHNKDLYAELELMKDIDRSLHENDIMQLRSNLKNITSENIHDRKTEQSITGRFWHKKMAISVVAASLILLLGLSALIRYTSEANVYQEFYARYETTGVSRSAESVPDQTFTQALQKYNKQDYQSALNLLQEVVSKDPGNIASHFYSGISLQELGKYNNAIKEYEIVVVDKDNLFMEQAEWYIGLCYLQTKEDRKAIKQFKKIANGNGFYQEKAVAILRKMKNNI
ncbi:MAG TPA: hypothetical protein VFG54_09050 [Prolixibacteraceae bacterium]|nr:hypothetical protein [Prolixibacteraceae bacterium]